MQPLPSCHERITYYFALLPQHLAVPVSLSTPYLVTYDQCCDLETMVSRLECTRVHFVQVSVSRPDGQGLSLGLET